MIWAAQLDHFIIDNFDPALLSLKGVGAKLVYLLVYLA